MTTAKKASAKTTAAKKTSAKKVSAKSTAAVAKKTSAAKEPSAKKAAKKVSAKSTAAETSAKEPAAKKSAAKKSAAKKTSATSAAAAPASAAKGAAAKPAGKRRKSWVDKLNRPMEPNVTDDPRGGGLLIPTPKLIEAEVKTVPPGKLITPEQIRERLAGRFGADRTCPLCTGIFLNIVAGAAEESSGDPREMTPYWRVVRENGALIEKFPVGIDRQAYLLEAEGHTVITGKWKIPRVDAIGPSLVKT
ncbi:MAG: MGMT family protein [Myxococcales bacterium]|nr:MGMT family protein [Myxococcales bacterium]